MKQFEYLVLNLKELPFDTNESVLIQDKLDSYGSVGWELVAVSNSLAYFKRQIQ